LTAIEIIENEKYFLLHFILSDDSLAIEITLKRFLQYYSVFRGIITELYDYIIIILLYIILLKILWKTNAPFYRAVRDVANFHNYPFNLLIFIKISIDKMF